MDDSYILSWEMFDDFFDDECSMQQARSSREVVDASKDHSKVTKQIRLSPFHPQLEEILACAKRNHII